MLKKTLILVSLIVGLSLMIAPVAAAAQEKELDYGTVGGHFYTQTNGYPLGANPAGFEITDEDGVPFWSEFQRLGGVDVLGYPISQRFSWDGFICQATQRAILQWDPVAKRVQLVNTLDLLSDRGHDAWLTAEAFIPAPGGLPPDPKGEFQTIFERRLAQLSSAQPISDFYRSNKLSLKLYGAPVSTPQRIGDFVAVRFQRNVLYHRAGDEQVIAGLAGDLAKRAGLIPKTAAQPQSPPSKSDSSHRVFYGMASWYGAGYLGRLIANGELFHMYNPDLAASNIFPVGTRLKVTRRSTGASVIVRVADRGAFRYPVLVDLSWAAFGKLGLPAEGVIEVSIQPLD